MKRTPDFYVPDPAEMTVEDNALFLQSMSDGVDRSKHEICDVCNERPSNHGVGDRRLCCKCYIEEGNAPADWHTGCMKYYKQLKGK